MSTTITLRCIFSCSRPDKYKMTTVAGALALFVPVQIRGPYPARSREHAASLSKGVGWRAMDAEKVACSAGPLARRKSCIQNLQRCNAWAHDQAYQQRQGTGLLARTQKSTLPPPLPASKEHASSSAAKRARFLLRCRKRARFLLRCQKSTLPPPLPLPQSTTNFRREGKTPQ